MKEELKKEKPKQEHDAKGRFKKGSPGGKGRPKKRDISDFTNMQVVEEGHRQDAISTNAPDRFKARAGLLQLEKARAIIDKAQYEPAHMTPFTQGISALLMSYSRATGLVGDELISHLIDKCRGCKKICPRKKKAVDVDAGVLSDDFDKLIDSLEDADRIKHKMGEILQSRGAVDGGSHHQSVDAIG